MKWCGPISKACPGGLGCRGEDASAGGRVAEEAQVADAHRPRTGLECGSCGAQLGGHAVGRDAKLDQRVELSDGQARLGHALDHDTGHVRHEQQLGSL